jgi:hypothetical protein
MAGGRRRKGEALAGSFLPVAENFGQQRVDGGSEGPTSSVAIRQMMSRLTAGHSCRRMLPIVAISRQGTVGWRAFIT